MTDDGLRATAPDSALARVATLVRQTHQAQRAVAQLEGDLALARAVLRDLSERDLPAALLECDYLPPTRAVVSGLAVDLDEKYRCGQLEYPPSPSSRRRDDDAPRARDPEAALGWLEENGHGDLEKHQVTVTLGRGCDAVAAELVEVLRRHPAANSFEVAHRRVVWWNTLAAFAREQVGQGGDPPLDLLGVRRVVRAKVSVPRERA